MNRAGQNTSLNEEKCLGLYSWISNTNMCLLSLLTCVRKQTCPQSVRLWAYSEAGRNKRKAAFVELGGFGRFGGFGTSGTWEC